MDQDHEIPWSSECPDAGHLKAFTHGDLPQALLDTIATHLTQCEDCSRALSQIDDDDNLIRGLRRHLRGSSPVLKPELDGSLPGVRNYNPEEIHVPCRLGPYLLLEVVGRGAMGVVFKARQLILNRIVAVKIARVGAIWSVESSMRLKRECEAIARLKHPHIVQIYEFGELQGVPYFSMEYLSGGTLAARLKAGKLGEREAVVLLHSLASAVECAHAHHVLHRDLKPANVLFAEDGVVRLTDFGLAKLNDLELGLTGSNCIIGTASYMSPEQASGDTKRIGPCSDIYSLGVILYELLTGQPPFQADTKAELFRIVQKKALVPPSHFLPAISPTLNAICLKCLEKDPRLRYSSTKSLGEDLERWLEGSNPTIRIAERLKFVWYRYSRYLAILAISVMIASLSLGMIALFSRPDPEHVAWEFQNQIALGNPVTLIGETGMPTWIQWLDGEATSKARLDENKVFHLDVFDNAWMELLPEVGCDNYRFEALIRHERSNLYGSAGIYVGHKTYSGDADPRHSAIDLQFNDVRGTKDLPVLLGKPNGPVPPMVNSAALAKTLFKARGNSPRAEFAIARKEGPTFVPKGAGKTDWRTLALDVSPQSVMAEWDGQRFRLLAQEMDRSSGDARVEGMQNRLPGSFSQIDSFKFSPRGGLGLHVYGGSIAVRSAVVIPR